MIIYEIYRTFIKENPFEVEFLDYFATIFFSIVIFPAEILLSPISIIALISYKIHKRRNNNAM